MKKIRLIKRGSSIAFIISVLILILLPFYILFADYSLFVEVRNVSDNNLVTNVSFNTNNVTDDDKRFITSPQYVTVHYSNESTNAAWGIRIYTYNTNYTGTAPYAGLISCPVPDSRLDLLWKIFTSVQPGGVPCSNDIAWGYIKDRRDNDWTQAPESFDLIRGTQLQGELASYPVAGRTVVSPVPLYLYLGVNCSNPPSGTNNYGTTLYMDIYHVPAYIPSFRITEIVPLQDFNINKDFTLAITGEAFQEGAEVKLRKSGQSDINATEVVVTPDKILADFDLTKAFKTGAWDLIVKNPDNETVVLPEGFLIRGFDMTGYKLIPVNNLFNPARGEKMSVKWSIEKEEKVMLEIYNVKGEIVKTFYNNEPVLPGVYQNDWYGNNNGNNRVGSGIYFIKMSAGAFNDIKKVVVVK
ncbi:MAG: hypothetical protein KKH98_08935 [Spirochaetes bacterium]|nr:hypothetical protein [Spirochaetota bacterium]